ncbi:MAG: glycosyltransferase [Burkholderiales bacterium]|nr:glycosyltransferase [Opitutaceae bacterium]
MKILHAIRSVNPHGGGPVEAIKQLAAVNKMAGHIIEVVCLDAPDDPWVKTFPLPCHAMGPSKGSYGYSAKFVPWLREHRRDYNAVVVDGLWQYHAFGLWRALHDTDTPYHVFTHGMLDPWFKRTYPLKHLKKWFYWPWGDYRVLRDARAVLFTCEEERRLARESFWLYRCNERVVNLGTGAPVGEPQSQRALFEGKFPEVRGKHCLLFLGRVHVKKGNDLLFHALAEVLKSGSAPELADWHLIIAGPNDHPYGQEMKALAERLGLADHVTWTGMVTGDLKWGAFHRAEAFVLPSHQENFGIAVAEALACRVPVLISNKVNIWREIDQDGAGLVENDDIAGTTKLLTRWLALSASEREAMRTRAATCFVERFHVGQSAKSLIAVLEGR